MPDLRERLAQIIAAKAKQYPPGYDLHEGCLHVADALLSSEDWQAREAVVKAAKIVVSTPDLPTWKGERSAEMDSAMGILCAALARLDAGKGDETR